MAGRSYFSHSRLSSYEQCPRKYRGRYLDKIASDRDGIEAFTGKLVHDSLEWLYRETADGRLPAPDALVADFDARWADAFDPARVEIVNKGKTADDYQSMGRRCLTGYHRRYAPFDQSEVLGLEVKLEAPLEPHRRFWMIGYADRISRLPSGAIEIRDYKTGRWVPDQSELDRNRQLALYQFAVQWLGEQSEPDSRFAGVTEVALVWNYLQRDVEKRSVRSRAQIEDLRHRTVTLAAEITARVQAVEGDPERGDELFPTETSRLCDWCDYKAICPAQGAAAGAWALAMKASRERRTGQLELF